MALVDPGASARAKQPCAAPASLRALSSEASSAFHDRPPWEGRRRDRYYALAAILIALAVFGWALLSLTADRMGAASYTEQRFCCSHLLATLAEVSNLSLAPCNSFFDFVCFRRAGIERLGITLKNLLSDVVSPILHGAAREPVSDVLRLFHASCTRAAVDTGLTLPEAVRNFITTLRLRVPLPHTDMLVLLGGMRLRYGVAVGVNITFTMELNGKSAILNLTALDANSVNEYNAELVLRASNPLLNTATTLKELISLYKDLAEWSDFPSAGIDWDARRRSSSQQMLDSEALLRHWKPFLTSAGVLERTSALAIHATDSAMRVLEALIAPERCAVVMTYLVVRAMEGLHDLAFLTAAHSPQSSANGQYCVEKTESLRGLWAMATFERLKSPRRNVYLSQVFSLMVAVVSDEVQKLGVTGRDAQELKHMLQDLRLQCFPDAMDEVAADMEKVPEMTSVYWTNVLVVRSHAQRLVLKRASLEAGTWWTLERGLYDVSATVRGDALYVSGALYSMLPRESDTDVFVNIALVGAHVANALWRQVFFLNSVSQRGRESLARFKTCAINRLGEKATGLEFAMLSIHSAAEGVKSVGWHDRVVPWGTTAVSASQVFYMTYFVSNICAFHRGTIEYNDTLRLGHWYMRRVLDFVQAFECRELAPLADDTCSVMEARV
ncbi:hypothetical protein HPB52_010301 [Rhipicephalus sanguineus]|uniref:Uncharacterized protein n=1 Tax=Rhipicephalus sanguineus TaxID=34632 RepID=A0A9D4PR24_RHISA|nr:hypothetical protein HPB52_010301 [Rhipicephalus sanguineus]